MDRLGLITLNSVRSGNCADDLGPCIPCRVLDLNFDTVLADLTDGKNTGIADLGPDRHHGLLLSQTCRGVPLVILSRLNISRARRQGGALCADRALRAQFGLHRIQAALELPDAQAIVGGPYATRQVEAAWGSYGTVAVHDRSITFVVIDYGTERIEQAIQENRNYDWVSAAHMFVDATRQHCPLIAGQPTASAYNFGFGACDRYRLTKAAVLRNLDEINVPTTILNKLGKLDAIEVAVMCSRPEYGVAIPANQGSVPKLPAEYAPTMRGWTVRVFGSGSGWTRSRISFGSSPSATSTALRLSIAPLERRC